MHIILIYEENKHEFDIPNDSTIKYIKELSFRIFNFKEKKINLIFDSKNLSYYDENIFLRKLVSESEKTIKIHLEKENSLKKNIIRNNPKISNSNSNDLNEQYYKSMKNKFLSFNSTYLEMLKEINNFNDLLENSIEKIIQCIRVYEDNILKINEKLNAFYNRKSYDKLIDIFEDNQYVKLTDKDINKINNEIESFIVNYKYLMSQHNFQINILDFFEIKIEEFKNLELTFFNIQNQQKYEEIIISLENIFTEIFIENKSINNKTINLNNNNINENFKKETIKKTKKIINDFPKIIKKPKKKNILNSNISSNNIRNKENPIIKYKKNENKIILSS